jgi:trans-2-enoyl-CoA reductase
MDARANVKNQIKYVQSGAIAGGKKVLLGASTGFG